MLLQYFNNNIYKYTTRRVSLTSLNIYFILLIILLRVSHNIYTNTVKYGQKGQKKS